MNRLAFSLRFVLCLAAALSVALSAVPSMVPGTGVSAVADEGLIVPVVSKRFADAAATTSADAPDFGRHVIPMLGRLGCNGRSCHGSFQGQGGFRLSLFGYDLKADHEALVKGDAVKGDKPRTSLEEPAKSLFLGKGTNEIPHEGGERMKVDSWEYRLLKKWVDAGAPAVPADSPTFVRLDVTPSEINFAKKGHVVRLQAIAVWADGRREDVTPLCRFQTNDETVAAIDINGVVTGGEPGDSYVVANYDKAVVPVPVMRPVSDKVGPKYPQIATPTEIDRLVVAKLQKLGIVPSDLSTDAEFLRRVSLDLTGTLPTVAEVEAFLADSSPNETNTAKRDRKIDELLERPAYAAWWATRLCDWTGNNPQQLNNVSPMQNAPAREWYDWVYKRVAANMPYDQLAANVVLATGQKPGQSYTEFCKEMSDLYRPDAKSSPADRETMPYFWARRNLRQPEEKALAFAYSFMGIRIQCAQCHKHPFDVWTQDDYKQFQNFFTRISYGVPGEAKKEQQEIQTALGFDPKKGGNNDLRKLLPQALKDGKTVPFEAPYVAKAPRNPNKEPKNADKVKKNPRPTFAQSARVLGGEMIDLADVDDPREPLMAWLRDPENPYFARAIVNRVWANYFSVGIVEPADDMSLANPPSNRPLLDHLAKEFIAHGFDMKWLHKEIVRSRTYQLSWAPNETNKFDTRNFARSIPRRVAAEVAYDAVRQATAGDAEVAAMQKDVFSRAIGGASLPGRGGKGGGSEQYALTVFGRSTRDSNCDCDRSMEPSLLQTVFLRNDQTVLQMIEGSKGTWVSQMAALEKSGGVVRATVAEASKDEPKPEASKAEPAKPEPTKSEPAAEGKKKKNQDIPRDSRLVDEIQRDIADAEKALEQAKASGKTGRIQKVENRLQQLKSELRNAEKRAAEKQDAEKALKEKAESKPDAAKTETRSDTAKTDTSESDAPKVNTEKARALRKELAGVEEQLAAAKKDDKQDEAKKLDKRVTQLRRELRQLLTAENTKRRKDEQKKPGGRPEGESKDGKPADSKPEAKTETTKTGDAVPAIQVASITAERLVQVAYLRTLSRHPDAKETAASLAYLKDSSTLADGLEGLMWALLNTKEFIVNH